MVGGRTFHGRWSREDWVAEPGRRSGAIREEIGALAWCATYSRSGERPQRRGSDSAWDHAPTPITELLLGLGHLDEWSGEDATGRADAAQDGAGARTRCGSGGVTRAGRGGAPVTGAGDDVGSGGRGRPWIGWSLKSEWQRAVARREEIRVVDEPYMEGRRGR
jgi:hypothetical protein